MDLQIQQFRDLIVNDINKTELPIEVKRLVLQEIVTKVTEASIKFITEQQNKHPSVEQNEDEGE